MAQTNIDVLGIGNAIVDVLSRADDSFLTKHALMKGAMALVDEPTAEILYADMGPGIEISGGSAANTIAGIASFGASSAFIGKVRDDQLGNVFGHDIRATGVAFTTPPALEGPATARCLILVTEDGERTMNTFLGASKGLAPDDVDDELVANSAITYLEGYLWDPSNAKQAFQKAARIARDAGNKVALSLSDAFCVERHRDSFLSLVRSDVDILFANESEIMSLYQVTDFDSAMVRAKCEAKLCVLTRSEKGCVIIDGDDITTVPAHPLSELVDTTGAGDLFAAGFLFGLTRDLPMRDCGALGALAASEVISHIGARPQTGLLELAKQNKLI